MEEIKDLINDFKEDNLNKIYAILLKTLANSDKSTENFNNLFDLSIFKSFSLDQNYQSVLLIIESEYTTLSSILRDIPDQIEEIKNGSNDAKLEFYIIINDFLLHYSLYIIQFIYFNTNYINRINDATNSIFKSDEKFDKIDILRNIFSEQTIINIETFQISQDVKKLSDIEIGDIEQDILQEKIKNIIDLIQKFAPLHEKSIVNLDTMIKNFKIITVNLGNIEENDRQNDSHPLPQNNNYVSHPPPLIDDILGNYGENSVKSDAEPPEYDTYGGNNELFGLIEQIKENLIKRNKIKKDRIKDTIKGGGMFLYFIHIITKLLVPLFIICIIVLLFFIIKDIIKKYKYDYIFLTY